MPTFTPAETGEAPIAQVPPIPRTRLAPSPTGALHLGNARTFLANWLLARQRGWNILLRIEDLDGPRNKRGADLQAIEDLKWLGLNWDQGPIYQRPRAQVYARAIQGLIERRQAYPCICSRADVQRCASAPHAEDGAAVYPGTCRGRFGSVAEALAASAAAASPSSVAIRFRVPNEILDWTDGFAGAMRCEPQKDLGDFVIGRFIAADDGALDYQAAYQLAVVVDDAEMLITDIVRGDDLLDSAPRQMLLYRALGIANRIPRYIHLPLVIGPDGRRLAKRHGDTRLSHYRQRGVSLPRLLALLARWLGMPPRQSLRMPSDLLADFDLNRIPRHAIEFSAEDEAWLTAETNDN